MEVHHTDSQSQPRVIVMSAPTAPVKRYNRFIRAMILVLVCLGALLVIKGSIITWIISLPKPLKVYYRNKSDSRNQGFHHNNNSMPIWVGLMVLIAATLNAFVFVKKSSQICLRIGCLAMSITTAGFCGIAVLVLCGEAVALGYLGHHVNILEGQHYFYAAFSLTAICCVFALLAMISCIIASSLWCYNFCDCCAPRSPLKTGAGGAEIVYVASGQPGENEPGLKYNGHQARTASDNEFRNEEADFNSRSDSISNTSFGYKTMPQ